MAKILIVDDSPTIATMFERIFGREGHEVATATDGVRGLELARALRPDLMVLDNLLPGLNGFDLCRTLKEDLATRSIKVLLLTGSQDAASAERGARAGADIYLTKQAGIACAVEAAAELLEGPAVA